MVNTLRQEHTQLSRISVEGRCETNENSGRFFLLLAEIGAVFQQAKASIPIGFLQWLSCEVRK